MFADVIASPAFGAWVAQFGLIVARLSFIVFLMPGIGEQVVPARVRLLLLLGFSAALASSGIVTQPPAATVNTYFLLLLDETMIGVALGLSLRLVIWILSIAGSIIAQSIGLSQFLGVAIEQEAQTIIANMLSMAGVVVLLSADYHVAAFVSLLHLYADVPTGLSAALDRAFLLNAVFSAFSFAILLAWPFVAVNLIYNICLGFINKALPQMMVAFVGAPFMVGAGVLLLAVSVTSLLVAWMDRVPDFAGWL